MRSLCSRCLSVSILLVLGLACSLSGTEDLSEYVIGVYVDEGGHPLCVSWAIQMFEWMGFSIREIEADDVNTGGIGDLSAIYFPGGDSPPYIENITPAGKRVLLDAVAGGMAYVGTCAGSMFAAEVQVWQGVRYRDGQLGVFHGDAVGPAPGICGGAEDCTTLLSVNGEHPVGKDASPTIQVMYFNSPYFRADLNVETHVLASYAATGESAIVAQRNGRGWVLLTGPHPEWEGEETWTFFKGCMLWSLGLLAAADM